MTDEQRFLVRSNGVSGYNPVGVVINRIRFVLLFTFLVHRSEELSTGVINGHSYLVQLSSSSTKSSRLRPPLVILPGFAQSISTFQSHVPTLSRERHVLLFQPYGLGGKISLDHDTGVDLTGPLNDRPSFVNVSLPAQADRLLETIDHVFPDDDDVDLAAFSLGARIALCAAVRSPRRIRRLHLTGISLSPSLFAKASFHAWKFMLRNGNLEGVAWSSLLGSYSPAFLAAQESRLVSWVTQMCDAQTSEGLLALLEQAYPDDSDEWSVASMVRKVATEAIQMPHIRLCVGKEDLIAPAQSVLELAEALGLGGASVTIVENCGHGVALEAPRIWRQSIVEFTESP